MAPMFAVLVFIIINTVNGFIELDLHPSNPAFDWYLYENALDPELCREQLQFIRSDANLRFKFLEAGMRLPKGILHYNTLDMGNYDQCLDIHEDIETSVIEGKFCMLNVPTLHTPISKLSDVMNWTQFDPPWLNETNLRTYQQIDEMKSKMHAIRANVAQPRTIGGLPYYAPELRMGLCVPKTCTSVEGINGLLFDTSLVGIHTFERFCRFKNDKPWAPVDTIAIVLLSFFGLLAILSTGYDLWHTFILKKDPKTSNTLCRSFSVYTNAKRLTTFTNDPNNLNCIDGIRAISMFWIIIGHTYEVLPPFINADYYWEYIMDVKSTWLTAAPFAVDTFLMLGGTLLVYTTVGKFSGMIFLKNIHLFYLNRLLRIFPLLATIVLLQASVFHRIADGPLWDGNAFDTDNCRTFWWATLLHVQNYINVYNLCIHHSWYLAIDMQCYFVSPIFLFWVMRGKKKQAWISLTAALLIALTICTTYSFIKQFPGWIFAPVREGGTDEYHKYYYYNTLTRAPPFFVGMVFGYLLSVWKGKKPNIPYLLNAFLWILSGGAMMGLMYTTHLMKDYTWDNWTVDDLMNSFGRSVWALALGWIIFACQSGYGGPANWFLCLSIWKLPSRVSLALYLFHFHLQFLIQGVARAPIFLTPLTPFYLFLSQVTLSFGVAFAMTLLIDSPISVLVKLILGKGPKKPQKKEVPDTE